MSCRDKQLTILDHGTEAAEAQGKPRSNSDLYALGIIGIQALTGVNPLDLSESEDGEIIWSHLVDVKPELEEVLTKMTRHNYRERYQSARSALCDLKSCDDVVSLPQSTSPTMLTENQLKSQSKSNEDLNALPGVRSVAIVASHSSRSIKAKIVTKRLAKIALGLIIVAGSYFSLQRFVIKPETDIRESPTTFDTKP